MRTWKFISLGVIALTTALSAAGCRTDPAVAMLERDNREKEDQINHLRFRIQELQDQLQDTPSPAARPRRQIFSSEAAPEPIPAGPILAPGETIDRPKSSLRDRAPATPQTPSLDVQLPDQPLQPDGLKPPPSNAAPQLLPGPNGAEAPRFPGGTPVVSPSGGSGWYRHEIPADPDADAHAANGPPTSAKVAQITLNESLTGGIGSEMTLSDHGLLVVVEPRDINGIIIDAPGAISAVLYDTALAGEATRVGRWDFTAAETSALLRPSPDHGIHLTLPWKSGPPEHAKLKLFVRYATQDGRKLQVEKPVVVAIAHDTVPQNREPTIPLPAIERSIIEPDHTARGPQRPVWSPDRPY